MPKLDPTFVATIDITDISGEKMTASEIKKLLDRFLKCDFLLTKVVKVKKKVIYGKERDTI